MCFEPKLCEFFSQDGKCIPSQRLDVPLMCQLQVDALANKVPRYIQQYSRQKVRLFLEH